MHAAKTVTADASSIPLATVAVSVLGLNNFLSPFIVFPFLVVVVFRAARNPRMVLAGFGLELRPRSAAMLRSLLAQDDESSRERTVLYRV